MTHPAETATGASSGALPPRLHHNAYVRVPDHGYCKSIDGQAPYIRPHR